MILFFLSIGAGNLILEDTKTETILSTQIVDNFDKSNWEYSDLTLISEGMVGDSYYPDIVVDSKQNIHVSIIFISPKFLLTNVF